MKVYIITKKRLAIFSAYLIVGAFVLYFATYGLSIATSSNNRLVPIYNVDTDKKQIAITFDSAWGADDTDEIISIFKENNAHATFFVLGEWVDKNPECVKKYSDAGHCIASHSNTHDSLARMSKSEIENQILTCNQKIEKVTGKKNKLLRAPSGDYNNNVIEVANDMGMYVIQWNIDSLDYRKISEDEIYRRVVTNAKSGDIILFHTDVANTPKVLPKIIKELQSKGFELVTVDELIYKEDYTIDHAGVQKPNHYTSEQKAPNNIANGTQQ